MPLNIVRSASAYFVFEKSPFPYNVDQYSALEHTAVVNVQIKSNTLCKIILTGLPKMKRFKGLSVITNCELIL